MRDTFDRKAVFPDIEVLRREDFTWQEIAGQLNRAHDLDLDESAYRKAYTEYRRGIETALPDDEFERIAEQRRKLRIEQRYIAFERSRNYKDIKTLAVGSMFTEEMEETIKGLSPERVFSEPATNQYEAENEYVFVMADLHFNGDEKMLGIIDTVFLHIIEKQKELGFKRIKLIELGDTFDGGTLRPSQLMALKSGMITQCITIAKTYSDLINKLTDYMLVDFHCVTSSNHTQIRNFGSGRNELVEEDLMKVFVEFIEMATSKNKKVTVTKGKDMIINVCSQYDVFISHGHLVTKKEGYLQELAFDRGINIDYGIFGHFHHYREVSLYAGDWYNKKVFYVPSLNTIQSSFEKDRNMSSMAGFIMIKFNAERGHCYTEELFV